MSYKDCVFSTFQYDLMMSYVDIDRFVVTNVLATLLEI